MSSEGLDAAQAAYACALAGRYEEDTRQTPRPFSSRPRDAWLLPHGSRSSVTAIPVLSLCRSHFATHHHTHHRNRSRQCTGNSASVTTNRYRRAYLCRPLPSPDQFHICEARVALAIAAQALSERPLARTHLPGRQQGCFAQPSSRCTHRCRHWRCGSHLALSSPSSFLIGSWSVSPPGRFLNLRGSLCHFPTPPLCR